MKRADRRRHLEHRWLVDAAVLPKGPSTSVAVRELGPQRDDLPGQVLGAPQDALDVAVVVPLQRGHRPRVHLRLFAVEHPPARLLVLPCAGSE